MKVFGLIRRGTKSFWIYLCQSLIHFRQSFCQCSPFLYLYLFLCLCFFSCSPVKRPVPTHLCADSVPVYPFYEDSIVIPPNIAPLQMNFEESHFCQSKGESLQTSLCTFKSNRSQTKKGSRKAFKHIVVLYAYSLDSHSNLSYSVSSDSSSNNPPLNFTQCSYSVIPVDSILLETHTSVKFPLKRWHEILQKVKGGFLKIHFYEQEKRRGPWIEYPTLTWFVAKEPIDPYLIYRLSAYEENPCDQLQVEERHLESFETRILMDNKKMDDNCMNCHACCKGQADRMSVHVRGKHSGTYLLHDQIVDRIQIPPAYSSHLRLTYPAWHPAGNHIAFSTNRIFVIPYSTGREPKDFILDLNGDIVIYNLAKNRLYSCKELMDTAYEDIFPCWAPDGKTLYFCRGHKAQLNQENALKGAQDFRFDLMQISFDSATEKFSTLRCVYPFSKEGKSVSMLEVSPDGSYLIVTILPIGTFPTLNEGDLYKVKLDNFSASAKNSNVSAKVIPLSVLNTSDAERFHNFSQNGRWMVFSTKRHNGAIAKVYISYVDKDGNFHKPFALPQSNSNDYLQKTRSFLFPVLTMTPSPYDAVTFSDQVKQNPVYPNMSYFKDLYPATNTSTPSNPSSKLLDNAASGH